MNLSLLLPPILIVLASGTFAGLANKILYSTKTDGACSNTTTTAGAAATQQHSFEKPYFLTFIMFLGESLCLLMYYLKVWLQKEKTKVWLNEKLPNWMYQYDQEEERRRRKLKEDAERHGIGEFDDEGERGSGGGKKAAVASHTTAAPITASTPFLPSTAASGDSSILNDDDDSEDEALPIDTDEEKAYLDTAIPGAAGPSPSASSAAATSKHPLPPSDLDPDLSSLHLTEQEQQRLIESSKPSKWVYLGLCLFDLSATALGGIGLLYIDASSNQMLRGSSVVFTALFSMCLLHRFISTRQWFGIGNVVLGLMLVGMCGLYRARAGENIAIQPDGRDATLSTTASSQTPLGASVDTNTSHNHVSSSGALLGLLLVLASAALNSIQAVFEEILVKPRYRIPGVPRSASVVDPLEIVGWEGIFGLLITGCIILPIVHYLPGGNCGSVESFLDTLVMMKNSWLITLLVVGFMFALALLNAYSIILSALVSSIFRQLINALRVIFIWTISIAMYYWLTSKSQGESWDRFSWMQLLGFVLLIVGTIVYGTRTSKSAKGDDEDVKDGALDVDEDAYRRTSEEDEAREILAKKKAAAQAVEQAKLERKKEKMRRKKQAGEEDASDSEDDEDIPSYDEEGVRIPKEPLLPIHVGGGRDRSSSKRSSGDKTKARSPGLEFTPADPRTAPRHGNAAVRRGVGMSEPAEL